MWKYFLTYFIILNVATWGIINIIKEFLISKIHGVFRIRRRLIFSSIFCGSLAVAGVVPYGFQTKGESVGDAIFLFFVMFLIGAAIADIVMYFFTLVQKRIFRIQSGYQK